MTRCIVKVALIVGVYAVSDFNSINERVGDVNDSGSRWASDEERSVKDARMH